MLLALQSLIVYGLIIGVMTYFGKIAYKRQYPQGYGGIDKLKGKKSNILSIFTESYILIPILIFCLFAAVRYRVGTDCEAYKLEFYEIHIYGSIQRRLNLEFGYKILCSIINALTGSHYALLFILAFLQIGLYYIALRKHSYALIFLSTAMILSGEYWSMMNGLRQYITACAFVATISLINKKKWLYVILITIVAMQMHKSALIIIPISITAYYMRNKLLNRYVQIGVLIFCILMMNKFNDIITSVSHLAANAGYSEEAITIYSELEETTKSFGFRMILLYSVHFITILYSTKMSKFFNNKEFNTWYNLYFIGICLSVLFYNQFIVGRILYYFIVFTPLILSHLFFYLKYNKKIYLLTTCILLLLIRTLYSAYTSLGEIQTETFLYKFDL